MRKGTVLILVAAFVLAILGAAFLMGQASAQSNRDFMVKDWCGYKVNVTLNGAEMIQGATLRSSNNHGILLEVERKELFVNNYWIVSVQRDK